MSEDSLRAKAETGAHLSDAPSISPDLKSSALPLTCFIIDDEPAIQNLLAGALAPFGCQPEKYRSAQAALVGLQRIRPQLVFLDGAWARRNSQAWCNSSAARIQTPCATCN
jgi:PleD family two-component response regulator